MGWIIKTKLNSVALTGGATYDSLNDSGIDVYKKLYVYNQTGADIKIKVNGSTAYQTIENKNAFETPEAFDMDKPCKDVVTANGTGTLVVEIHYWEYI